MIWFVIAIIAVLAGVIALFAARWMRPNATERTDYNRRQVEEQDAAANIVRGIGFAAIALSLVILGFDSTTTVPTRTFGVETAFGKPTAVMTNGWHFVAPWASVDTSFQASVQTLKLTTGKDADGPAVTVRLANQTTATVDVSVQWQLTSNADILALYKQYRQFDNIQTNVIQRQLANALNKVFENFNPLASLDSNGNQTVHVTDLATQVTTILQSEMPPGVQIDNVTIPLITYDAQIETQINSIISASSATRVAQQQEQTAAAIQAANNKLAAGNTSAGVEYQNCLNLVSTALKAGETLPPGFSCGTPGASVVIPTK